MSDAEKLTFWTAGVDRVIPPIPLCVSVSQYVIVLGEHTHIHVPYTPTYHTHTNTLYTHIHTHITRISTHLTRTKIYTTFSTHTHTHTYHV